MKIQIDSAKKIIKLDEQVNLGELFKFLTKLLPKDSPIGDWKEYKLDAGNVVINNWSSPIYIDRWHNPTPYWQQPYFFGVTGGCGTLTTTGQSYAEAVGEFRTTSNVSYASNVPSTLTCNNGSTTVYNMEVELK